MAARHKGKQGTLDDLLLADDYAANLRPQGTEPGDIVLDLFFYFTQGLH